MPGPRFRSQTTLCGWAGFAIARLRRGFGIRQTGAVSSALTKGIGAIMKIRLSYRLGIHRAFLAAIAAAAVVAGPAVAGANAPQSGPEPPSFEVASVKPAGSYVRGAAVEFRGGPGSEDPGRFTWLRATLGNLLTMAYDVHSDQIEAPGWVKDINSTYVYSIAVTMDPKTTREQFRLMLQGLLAERFHLRLHHEAQPRPGYALAVAKGGIKLKEWVEPKEGDSGQAAGNVAGFPALPTTGTGLAMRIARAGDPVLIHVRDSMDGICRMLGQQISRSNGDPVSGPQPRVVDRTGLQGIYEFTLKYTTPAPRLEAMSPASAGGEASVAAVSDTTERAPDVFKAMEEQLGLRLQKGERVAVDVLVIDSADQVPAEN